MTDEGDKERVLQALERMSGNKLYVRAADLSHLPFRHEYIGQLLSDVESESDLIELYSETQRSRQYKFVGDRDG